jgi:hypothetical protein
MDRVPSWLRELLKRFIQYLAVPLASIPAGIVYLVLLRIMAQPAALAITLPLGVALAYCAWAFLDKRISFASKPTYIEAREWPPENSIGTSQTLVQTNADNSRLAETMAAAVVVLVLSGTQPVMTLEFSRSSQRAGTTNKIVSQTPTNVTSKC